MKRFALFILCSVAFLALPQTVEASGRGGVSARFFVQGSNHCNQSSAFFVRNSGHCNNASAAFFQQRTFVQPQVFVSQPQVFVTNPFFVQSSFGVSGGVTILNNNRGFFGRRDQQIIQSSGAGVTVINNNRGFGFFR